MPYSLIVDVLVAVLLVITIGFAIVLNKRLGKLRRDKAALEKLAATFGDSTSRAEESIEKLKNTAELLQERMDQAEALRDDLAFLIDRGGKTADGLEDLVRAARDKVGVGIRPNPRVDAAGPPPPGPGPAPEAGDGGDGDDETGDGPGSDAEKELLRAIRSAG